MERIKVYLAPIIDGYNAEIIAYNISFSPNMKQQHEMLSQLQNERYDGMILHSDQGWQYQHAFYQQSLKERGNYSINVSKRKLLW